jgi:hypothetical protein
VFVDKDVELATLEAAFAAVGAALATLLTDEAAAQRGETTLQAAPATT